VALGIFFVIGLALLVRVDMRRGIREAGNAQPTVV
jgi:UMF1 family MFS transporter